MGRVIRGGNPVTDIWKIIKLVTCSLRCREGPTRLEDRVPVASSRLFIPYSVHLNIMLSLFYYFNPPPTTTIWSALMLLKEVGDEKGFNAFPIDFRCGHFPKQTFVPVICVNMALHYLLFIHIQIQTSVLTHLTWNTLCFLYLTRNVQRKNVALGSEALGWGWVAPLYFHQIGKNINNFPKCQGGFLPSWHVDTCKCSCREFDRDEGVVVDKTREKNQRRLAGWHSGKFEGWRRTDMSIPHTVLIITLWE